MVSLRNRNHNTRKRSKVDGLPSNPSLQEYETISLVHPFTVWGFKKYLLQLKGRHLNTSLICYICQAKGHRSNECPLNFQQERNPHCLWCRQHGHMIQDCPEERTKHRNYGGFTGKPGERFLRPLQDAIETEERLLGLCVAANESGDNMSEKDRCSSSIPNETQWKRKLGETDIETEKKYGEHVTEIVSRIDFGDEEKTLNITDIIYGKEEKPIDGKAKLKNRRKRKQGVKAIETKEIPAGHSSGVDHGNEEKSLNMTDSKVSEGCITKTISGVVLEEEDKSSIAVGGKAKRKRSRNRKQGGEAIETEEEPLGHLSGVDLGDEEKSSNIAHSEACQMEEKSEGHFTEKMSEVDHVEEGKSSVSINDKAKQKRRRMRKLGVEAIETEEIPVGHLSGVHLGDEEKSLNITNIKASKMEEKSEGPFTEKMSEVVPFGEEKSAISLDGKDKQKRRRKRKQGVEANETEKIPEGHLSRVDLGEEEKSLNITENKASEIEEKSECLFTEKMGEVVPLEEEKSSISIDGKAKQKRKRKRKQGVEAIESEEITLGHLSGVDLGDEEESLNVTDIKASEIEEKSEGPVTEKLSEVVHAEEEKSFISTDGKAGEKKRRKRKQGAEVIESEEIPLGQVNGVDHGDRYKPSNKTTMEENEGDNSIETKEIPGADITENVSGPCLGEKGKSFDSVLCKTEEMRLEELQWKKDLDDLLPKM